MALVTRLDWLKSERFKLLNLLIWAGVPVQSNSKSANSFFGSVAGRRTTNRR